MNGVPLEVIVQVVIGVLGLGVIIERINSLKTVITLLSGRVSRIEHIIDKDVQL